MSPKLGNNELFELKSQDHGHYLQNDNKVIT
jgi:hypothetical protein